MLRFERDSVPNDTLATHPAVCEFVFIRRVRGVRVEILAARLWSNGGSLARAELQASNATRRAAHCVIRSVLSRRAACACARAALARACCRGLTLRDFAWPGGGRHGSTKQAPGPVQHGQVLLALFKHLRGAHRQAAKPEEEAGSSLASSLRDTHALTPLTRTNPHLLSVTAESGGSNALFELVPEYRDMDLLNCS